MSADTGVPERYEVVQADDDGAWRPVLQTTLPPIVRSLPPGHDPDDEDSPIVMLMRRFDPARDLRYQDDDNATLTPADIIRRTDQQDIRRYRLALTIGGILIAAAWVIPCHLFARLSGASLPYQDPTPQMLAAQAAQVDAVEHELTLWGPVAMAVALLGAVIVGYGLRLRRRLMRNRSPKHTAGGDHQSFSRLPHSRAAFTYARIRLIIEAVAVGLIGAALMGWAVVDLYFNHAFSASEVEAASYLTVACGAGISIISVSAIAVSLLGRAALADGVVDPAQMHDVLVLGKASRWAAAIVSISIILASAVVVLSTGGGVPLFRTLQGMGLTAAGLGTSMSAVRTTIRLLTSLAEERP